MMEWEQTKVQVSEMLLVMETVLVSQHTCYRSSCQDHATHTLLDTHSDSYVHTHRSYIVSLMRSQDSHKNQTHDHIDGYHGCKDVLVWAQVWEQE